MGNDVDNGPKYRPEELNAPMATNLRRNVDRRTGYPWKSLRFVVVIIYIVTAVVRGVQGAAAIFISLYMQHYTNVTPLHCNVLCMINLSRSRRQRTKV